MMPSLRTMSGFFFAASLSLPSIAHAQEAAVSAEASVATPVPTAAPMPVPPPVVPDPNAAQVSIDSGRHAVAIDLVPINGGAAAHCDATPCPITLPPGSYRLHTSGPRVRDVDQSVDLATGHNSIHVRTGNQGSFVTGAVLVGIGGAVFLGGGAFSAFWFYEGASNHDLLGWVWGSVFTVVTLAISVPMVTAGGVMMGRGHSDVRVDHAERGPQRTPMQWAVLPTVTREAAGVGFVATF